MKLSLCVICKNEERTIERCINSVKNEVDEMIIVDTGSTDKTIDIAKSLGAEVFEIEWEKDFAKARNYAISKATGDWIIFLDADEYVLEEDRQYTRNYVIEAMNRDKEAILVEMINVGDKDITSIFRPIRLFKRHSNIMYTGKIHEIIYRTDRTIKMLTFREPLRIMHDGYMSEVQNEKDKGKRNLELLLKEFGEKPKDANLCYYLMETYYGMGELEKGCEFADKVIEYGNGTLIGILQMTYNTLLSMYQLLNRTKEEIRQKYDTAIQIDDKYPDFDYAYGAYLYNNELYEEAIIYFGKCLNKIESYNGIIQSTILGNITQVYQVISHCYLRQGKLQEALPFIIKILRIDRYEYNSLYNLVSNIGKIEAPERLAEFLYKLYDIRNPKDQEVLKVMAQKVGQVELLNYIQGTIDNLAAI